MKGCETQKRLQSKDWSDKYLQGNGLDIGFAGYVENPEPIVPNSIGIDIGYPGYDGENLPFASSSQDFVFAGHVLEHIQSPLSPFLEWWRVLKVGGFLTLVLPHQYLYEKKVNPPSQFCTDHKKFYTPASLLAFIEFALLPNSYRITHLKDIDENFDYSRPPKDQMDWFNERFEIECVLKKISKPEWDLILDGD
jgi:predicted SAM-dependent methyltransferase